MQMREIMNLLKVERTPFPRRVGNSVAAWARLLSENWDSKTPEIATLHDMMAYIVAAIDGKPIAPPKDASKSQLAVANSIIRDRRGALKKELAPRMRALTMTEGIDDTMQFFRDLDTQAKGYHEPEEYEVRRDGDLVFIGTHDECIDYILHHQTHSVDDALTNGGWEIGRFNG